MDPYISIEKESIEKESELIDISLETNEKETKNKNINHGSIKPSRDLLKNEKEESYVNTTE